MTLPITSNGPIARTRSTLLLSCLAAVTVITTLPDMRAATLLEDHDLGGTQADLVYENLTSSNPAWVSVGSGDAGVRTLNTATTGTGTLVATNGGYPATFGLYKWSGSLPYYTVTTTKNDLGFDAQTVVLQMQWSPNTTYEMSDVVLNYNGGTQAILPTWEGQSQGSTPVWVDAMGQYVNYSVYTWQWDLSSLGGADINSLSVIASPTIHTSTVSLSLEVGGGVHSAPLFSAVPEPSRAVLMLAGLSFIFMRRKRSSL